MFRFAGISYLTNEYILKAVTNPAVILTLVLLIVLFVLYCSYEMSFLTTCFELKRQECTASIIETGLTALKHIRPLFQIKNIPLALFYFIMILTINVAICGNVLYSQTAVNLFKMYILQKHMVCKRCIDCRYADYLYCDDFRDLFFPCVYAGRCGFQTGL